MKTKPSAPDVSRYTDADQLRSLMANARRLGREDVYWQAFGRLCDLHGMAESDPLHRDFAKTLVAYEELLSRKNSRTTKAMRTRQKIANKGVAQALVDWALGAQPTEGFKLLMDNGLEELTGEYLVVKYADRFTPHAVDAANTRLDRYRAGRAPKG